MPCLDSYGPLKRPQFPHAQEEQTAGLELHRTSFKWLCREGYLHWDLDLLDLQNDGR